MSGEDTQRQSLFSTNPELRKIWHPTRNSELNPDHLSASSHKKVWWICEEGHETQSEVRVRAKGHRCAVCSNRIVLAGFNDLATTHPQLATEFDSELNAPVEVTQIQVGSKPKFWWRCSVGHSFSSTVATRIKSAGCPICNNKKVLAGFNDLGTTHTEIAALWHPKKNLPLTPSQVVAGSDRRVWWRCDQQHEYQTSVYNKIKNTNCPVCSKKLLIQGVNDLQTTNPELSSQWHPSKNGTLTPNSVTAINSDLVWWNCPKGHEYQLQIKRRVKAKSCSVCSNSRFVQGLNDFESRFPEIASTWIFDMNGGKSPSSVSAMSKTKFWWRCERNPLHEYKASVQDRVFGSGCAVCSGRQVMQGVNDLATLRPDLLRYWDHNKNIIKPTEISIGSGKKVWWTCELGHEMFLAPAQKTSKGVECAVCARKKVLKGYNDLQTTHPEVTKRWHPNLNESLMPYEVVSGSNKKVWWVCESDARHVFQSPIYVQSNHSGNGCPICSGKQVVSGLNDLSTLAPDLISEWNEAKNKGLSPSTFSLGSDKKVWWICNEGHEWRSSVKNRTKNLSGCPRCTRSGYDPTLPGLFYFIENRTLFARKVGVTNPGVKNQRTQLFKKFGWSMIDSFESNNGHLILDIETHVLRWIRKDLGLPRYLDSVDMNHMGGASETFSASDPSNEVILKKIREIQSHLQEKHHPQH